jgi:flagellar FliJ protein
MAKKFIFRLDPLLKLRNFKVKEAKEDLGKAVKIRLEKEKELNEMNNYFHSLLKTRKGLSSAAELQTQWHHKNYIEGELVTLETEGKKLLEIESVKRQLLTKAMKEEKVLEKLKERKELIYKEEIGKEETKELDEIGSKRHFLHEDQF